MRSTALTRCVYGAAFLLAIGWAGPARAQIRVGNWVRTDAAGQRMTMTVETCCKGGYHLTYHVPVGGGQPPVIMTVALPMDGTEVPTMIAGKPTGQMMSAKRVDDHHYTGAVKQNGKLSLTNTATLSTDGKTLTVEDKIAGGATVTETWVKK